jgi:hypothetical protein
VIFHLTFLGHSSLKAIYSHVSYCPSRKFLVNILFDPMFQVCLHILSVFPLKFFSLFFQVPLLLPKSPSYLTSYNNSSSTIPQFLSSSTPSLPHSSWNDLRHKLSCVILLNLFPVTPLGSETKFNLILGNSKCELGICDYLNHVELNKM